MIVIIKSNTIGSKWLIAAIGFCLLVFFLSGCSMGGGTIGTGINSYGTDSKTGLIAFSVEGIVKDFSGKFMGNASISIFSSEGEGRAITTSKGRYLIPLAFAGGEEVEIIVKKGNSSWSCKKFISPEGQDFIKINLITEEAGKLNCVVSR